jgi:hypothetical protein
LLVIAIILLAILLFWTVLDDNMWNGGLFRGEAQTHSTASLSSAQKKYGRHVRQCPALKYATITCPTWDDQQDDGGSDVDYRVRWIYDHQNPRESSCEDVNYLFRSHLDYIGFGGDIYLVLASALYLALYSDRIFLLNNNVAFRYANCSSGPDTTTIQTWECYFMPLSRCTIQDAEQIGQYGEDYLNASHRVLKADKVVCQHRLPSFHFSCHLHFYFPVTQTPLEQLPIGLAPHGPWSWYARKQEHPWWVKGFLFPGKLTALLESPSLVTFNICAMWDRTLMSSFNITSGDEDVVAGALLFALRPNSKLRQQTERVSG